MKRPLTPWIAYLLLVMCSWSWSQSLSQQDLSKLDPFFQTIVAHHTSQTLAKAPALSREPSGYTKEGAPLYDAIIYARNPDDIRGAGVQVHSSFPGFVTVQVTATDLVNLSRISSVRYIDPGTINYPATDISVKEIGGQLIHGGYINSTSYKGQGAIVLIYDTGIDWKHLDFCSTTVNTKSRILFIWDQTLTAQGSETAPSGLTYGVEYTQAQINDELDGTPASFVREADINGHGTHVAGTTVGNGQSFGNRYVGVAPEADIIVVKGGDGSFLESRMIDGLTYAQNKAAALGKPIVVNWSIGGQVGPHDGSRPYELAVNSFSSAPGRIVCIAAGNEGGALIHRSGSVTSGGGASISINVPSYSANAGTNNDQFLIDLWFNSNPTVTATVTTPSNVSYTGEGADGFIQLTNETSSLNDNRHVQLWVRDQSTNLPKTGQWTLTISGSSVAASFDAWMGQNSFGAAMVGGDNNKSVSMPGTSSEGITVGSYVTKWSWPTYDNRRFIYTGTDRTGNISTFSGIGPTGDGRQKPDIAAPGQGISASLSSAVDTGTIGTRIHPGLKHWLIQGTSMATPHVAGLAALMLGATPTITAVQVKSFITSTANTDGFTGGVPNFTWGNGKLDAYEAMAKSVGISFGASRSTISYASPAMFFILLPSTNLKFAMRFTPQLSGKLSGVSLTLNGGASAIKGTGSLMVSVAQNTTGSVAGVPGAQIGGSVTVPFSSLGAGSANFIDMSPANASITSGSDFHVVWEVVGGAGDTLQFLLDNGTTSPTDRASSYRSGVNGLAWYNRADPNYLSGRPGSFENFLISGYIAVPVVVEEVVGGVPASFELYPAYPNPFNPSTTIRFSIVVKDRVRLRVFDLLGRQVVVLLDEVRQPGVYEVKWSSQTSSGVPATSGVYFCRLEQGSRVRTQKVVLLK